MRRFVWFLALALVVSSGPLAAQQSRDRQLPVQGDAVPRVIRITGALSPGNGRPLAQVETITLRVYADESSGAVLWEETQHVIPDGDGRYSVLLGSTRPDGVPLGVFTSGEARWVGVTLEGPGERESARMRLVSVPYALRASDADTLGGLPASAFARATDTAEWTTARPATGSATATAADAPSAILPGTPTALAKYSTSTDLVGSSIFALSNGLHGVNTAAPRDAMHVQFTNTSGSLTGYAVQNLGSTATSYSGTLFYDHNGVLGQFQGFNNLTHEYRINNVARNGASQFDGSINFMVGGTSRFLVTSGGNIGIGTTTPTTSLEVSNALTGASATTITATTFGDNLNGAEFIGRKSRGTAAAPASVFASDVLAIFGATGRSPSGFSPPTGQIIIRAAEGFTNSARGTWMYFGTTARGAAAQGTRMLISPEGNVGIGTGFTFPEADFEVQRTGQDSVILASAFDGEPFVLTQVSRGTPAAPLAIIQGDELGVFGGGGYDGTNINFIGAGFGVMATQNWDASSHGSALIFGATANDAADPSIYMSLRENGFVGIGTPLDTEGVPTALDRLQVFGDLRVGTTGTDGCVKRFDGNALTGVCASDARFKKNVTSFESMLAKVSALRPVHYDWRTSDFPERHFSSARSYGLIAQEVEAVLPDLVVTNADGYKAVDYTKLPLLAVQAIKELKAENDTLRARLQAIETDEGGLRARVATLERMIQQLLASQR